MKQYKTYGINEITKELLNTIGVGDLIKCNNWRTPLKVKAVSEHYFVMTRPFFDKTEYSICQKFIPNWRRNNVSGENFIIGLDDRLFNTIGDYSIKENAEELLRRMESGEYEMSVRSSVDLIRISIKKDKTEK